MTHMHESKKRERRVVVDILWYLRTTSYRQLFRDAIAVKHISQQEFVIRLQAIGHTPKGTKS